MRDSRGLLLAPSGTYFLSMSSPKDCFKNVLEIIDANVRSYYGKRLASLVVFGSVARGTATPESDIDLLIIAESLPVGRLRRVAEFEEVERAVERQTGGRVPPLSPIFKSPEEAAGGNPLYYDMTEYALILYDRDGLVAQILHRTRERMRALGARKIQRGNAWYWILKKDFAPGEVFAL